MKLFGKFNVDRPIVFFDFESTGVDVEKDRIVEFSFVRLNINGKLDKFTKRVNPGIPIPKEASEIHKIWDADVENEPLISNYIDDILTFIEGCDLAGYNIIKYDVPLMINEFARHGVNITLDDCKQLDVFSLFCTLFPRNLTGAVRFFLNEDFEDAHGAEADTIATIRIFKEMLKRGDVPDTYEEVDKFCFPEKSSWVDKEGKFITNSQNEIVINFSKYKGKTLRYLVENERGFLNWILNNNFHPSTKEIVMKGFNEYR